MDTMFSIFVAWKSYLTNMIKQVIICGKIYLMFFLNEFLI